MTTKAERAQARDELRELLHPGDVVHTVLRSVARSGMSRTIDLYRLEPDPTEAGGVSVRWLSYWTARALTGASWDERREAVRVSGCGMDMGFHLVYSLGAALWPDGFFCTGDGCPSNAHSNGRPRPHAWPTEWLGHAVAVDGPCPVHGCQERAANHPTGPAWHGDGGYALRHRWIG